MTKLIHPLKVAYDINGIASGISEFKTGDAVAIDHGGTGASSISDAKVNLGILTKFTTGAIMDGVVSSIDVDHNIGTTLVIAQVYKIDNTNIPTQVQPEIKVLTNNRLRVRFGYIPPNLETYSIIVIG